MDNKYFLGGVGLLVVALVAVGIMTKPNITILNGEARDGQSVDVAGIMEQTLGAISQKASKFTDVEVTNALSTSGDTRLASMVQTGSVATVTVTTTLTAAQICDSTLIKGTAATGTPTYTLPPTSTLFADCLTANGDMKMLGYVNGSATTGTVFAAGTGGTLLYSSSLTVAAAKGAFLRIIRDSATTYTAVLINAAN
jgi:hypothetical protein